MNAGAPVVAAADWGTSRLRVWLLDASGAPLAERRSDEGMTTARESGFAAVLEGILEALGAPADLPVIICGMAGARQGWLEAPYVHTPAPIAAILDGAVRIPGVRRDIRIVPGLAQTGADAPDVMRGEETQLAGALSNLAPGAQLVCMPGTHSKWVEMENGVVKRFSTWMTGELFALMSTSSILRHSIGSDPEVSADDPAFRRAVEQALADPEQLTRRFFGLRAGSLLHGLQPRQAAAALSGLLIGTEIAAARPREGTAGVVLVAAGRLRDLYAEAFRVAGCGVTQVDADEAVRAGLFAAARHIGLVRRKVDA